MILVTGVARSGTSLTTAILGKCGANLGNVNDLNEHEGVREMLVKPYLSSIGADPAGQGPLPALEHLRPAPNWRDAVLRLMGQPEPWVYKECKIALMWPIWARAFPEAKWVIVRRDREQIIESCLRTSFMQKHTTREGWGQWADHYVARLEELKANADCIEVWPERYIADPSEFWPVADFCGLVFDPKHVRQTVDLSKWHG